MVGPTYLGEGSYLLVSLPMSDVIPSAGAVHTSGGVLSLLTYMPRFVPRTLFVAVPPAVTLFARTKSKTGLHPGNYGDSLAHYPVVPN